MRFPSFPNKLAKIKCYTHILQARGKQVCWEYTLPQTIWREIRQHISKPKLCISFELGSITQPILQISMIKKFRLKRLSNWLKVQFQVSEQIPALNSSAFKVLCSFPNIRGLLIICTPIQSDFSFNRLYSIKLAQLSEYI